MTPQIDQVRKMSPVLRFLTHIYGVSKEIDGKTFIFRVNLGMWSLKSIILENWVLFSGFQHTLWGFQGDRMENIHFLSKSRHVTCQINCLRKSNPILRVSTHIYRVLKKIDGQMFIFWVNLSMCPLKLIVSEKWSCSGGFITHLWGFQEDRWENIHF